MSKNKKKKNAAEKADPRFNTEYPAANSAEFVPDMPGSLPLPGDDAEFGEAFDFIPDIKGNKFS